MKKSTITVMIVGLVILTATAGLGALLPMRGDVIEIYNSEVIMSDAFLQRIENNPRVIFVSAHELGTDIEYNASGLNFIQHQQLVRYFDQMARISQIDQDRIQDTQIPRERCVRTDTGIWVDCSTYIRVGAAYVQGCTISPVCQQQHQ